MAATFVHTRQCRRVVLAEAQGLAAEIVNEDLCGAKNVTGTLRWLNEGDRFDAESLTGKHQLFYLMEGSGVITLEEKEYEVSQGAGIYLGPGETASVRPAGKTSLKLFWLVVPETGGGP